MSKQSREAKRTGFLASLLGMSGGRKKSSTSKKTSPKAPLLAESLGVEPLEARLAMAVAGIDLRLTGPGAIDLFGSVAGAELSEIYSGNRSFRDDGAPQELSTIPGGFYITSAITIDEGTGQAILTITRDTNLARTATVDYSVAGGSAVVGRDLPSSSGTVSFAAGVSSIDITIPITDDQYNEATEQFFVNLSNARQTSGPGSPAALRIVQGQTNVTITDDDPIPDLIVDDVAVDEGAGTLTFTVTRQTNTAGEVTVDFATASGTAGSGTDFTGVSGTLTFADGVTTQTIVVPINDDLIYEKDETFTVTLSNAVNLEGGQVTISDPEGQGTILNNEALPELTITDQEVHESGGTVTFTVTLDKLSEVPMEIDYATVDLTTAETLDYVPISGRFVFAAGVTTTTFVVTILEDNIVESEEYFELQITNPNPTTYADPANESPNIIDGVALGTIIDNDVRLSVADIQVIENVGNPPGLRFTIVREGATRIQTDVNYRTVNGSAVAPGDYAETIGTATFLPGDVSITIDVQLNDDDLYEFIETMQLEILSASNPLGGDVFFENMSAVGTITDDDPPPNVSISDASVFEHDGVMTFDVSLDAAAGVDVVVTYSTADGTAVAGSDYTGVASGTVTIPAGQTSATVSITIREDNTPENPNETFTVNLLSASNGAVIVDPQGIGTIQDNDNVVRFELTTVSVNEDAGTVTLMVQRTGASDTTSTVNWSLANGSATALNDYAPAGGVLTFNPGDTQQFITVDLIDDTIYEGNETFTVNLSAATNLPGGMVNIATTSSLVTIIENDAAPEVSISDAEGFEHDGTLTFTISLSTPAAVDTVVHYATRNGSATSGSGDYTAIPNGSVTISAGQTTRQITVTIANDQIREDDENFFVDITSVDLGSQIGAGGIADGEGEGLILDNDVTLTITGGDVDENGGFMTFTVTRTGTTNVVTTVDYSTVDGTALAGLDFTPATGTVEFQIGENTATFDVQIIDNAVYTGDKFFFGRIQNPANSPGGTAIISVGTALANIVEDEPPPELVIDDIQVLENEGVMVFTVTLLGASDSDVIFAFHTVAGTAVANNDYAHIAGAHTFTAGIADQTLEITVPILDDGNLEGDETFTVELFGVIGNGVIATDIVGTGTILNDDVTVNLVGDPVATEGFNANIVFTLNRTGGQNVTTVVNLALFPAGATPAIPGVDFQVPGTMSVTFAPGETSRTFSVPIINDSLIEVPEFLELRIIGIANQEGGNVGSADISSIGTIFNALSAGDPTFNRPNVDGTASGNIVHYETYTFTIGGFFPQLVVLEANRFNTSQDYFLALYSGTDITNLANFIEADDDDHPTDPVGPPNRNPLIVRSLGPGTYTVVVTTYSASSGLGSYGFNFNV